MKKHLLVFCLALPIAALAFNPSDSDFNTNQFSAAAKNVTIKSGARLTNIVVRSASSNAPSFQSESNGWARFDIPRGFQYTASQFTTNLTATNDSGAFIIGTNYAGGGVGPTFIVPSEFEIRSLNGNSIKFWLNHGGHPLILIESENGDVELRSGYNNGILFGSTGGYRNGIVGNKRNDELGWSWPYWYETQNTNGAGGVVYGGIAGWSDGGSHSTLRFYSRAFTRQTQQGAGFTDAGTWVGSMETNGWSLAGKQVRERQATAPSAVVVDFNKPYLQDFSPSAASVAVTFTNYLPGATNTVKKLVYIRSSGYPSLSLSWPSGVNVLGPTGTETLPASIGGAKILRLELETTGVGATNVQVLATLGTDNSFSYDADAESFFTRASITDTTQKLAVNTLITDLKANSLWTKMDAIYPFVGGNSTAHSKNLKANAFNITWSGSVTHDANGITGDGSTGYGDTGWIVSVDAAQNASHGFVYSRTQSPTDAKFFFSSVNTAGTARFEVWPNSGNLTGRNAANDQASGGASSDFRGFLGQTRTSSSQFTSQIRTTQATQSSTSVAAVPVSVTLLARNFQSFGVDNHINANLAFACFGDGLTTGEASTLKTIVDSFESSLGRNVP